MGRLVTHEFKLCFNYEAKQTRTWTNHRQNFKAYPIAATQPRVAQLRNVSCRGKFIKLVLHPNYPCTQRQSHKQNSEPTASVISLCVCPNSLLFVALRRFTTDNFILRSTKSCQLTILNLHCQTR